MTAAASETRSDGTNPKQTGTTVELIHCNTCRSTSRPILSFCQCGVMRSWHKYVFLMHCDAIRKRPSMSVSLSSASLLSSHAFGMLAVFFVLVFDFGQISVVGRPVGELLEAGSMILWSFLLIPLSLSLHHLCEFRTKQAHHRSRILSLVGPVTVKSYTLLRRRNAKA